MNNTDQQSLPIQPQANQPLSSVNISPSKKIVLILGIFLTLILLGIGGYFFVANRNQNSSLQQISVKTQNLNLAILFSITKGRLQDHNYDTYAVVSSQTYKSDLVLNNKTPVNIGYKPSKSASENELMYQSTENGKYLLRSTRNMIEIAPSNQIESFTKIFELPNGTGTINSFLISQDESKIVILYEQAGKKIVIQDLMNPQIRITVVPQKGSDSYTIFGYDSKQNKLYWQRSEGPMTHYTEVVSIGSNGNISNVKSLNDYSFITEFDSNFQYAYYEGYGSEKEGYKRSIIQHNLQTDQKTKLAEFPSDISIVDLKLSPIENKLFFIDNAATKNRNTLYVIDILTKKVETFPVDSGLNPNKSNYVSPDGRYLLFQNTLSCRNDDCNTDHDGEEILFDIEKKQFYRLYTSIGVKEAFKDDSNSYHDIENLNFIGWLATPGVTSVQLDSLAKVTFSEPTPTPTPLAYPLQQFDIQKKKIFFFSYKYPDEVMNIDTKNLVGMKCTPRLTFESPYDSGYHYNLQSISGGKIAETSPTIIQLVKEALKTIDLSKDTDTFINATYCQTATNDTILEYQSAGNSKLSNSGDVANGTDYVGYKPSGEAFKKVATIVLEDRTAHTCSDPMMLTSDYKFYLTCNAFEGPSIYKIDLKNATQQRIYNCLHKNRDTGNDTIICE